MIVTLVVARRRSANDEAGVGMRKREKKKLLAKHVNVLLIAHKYMYYQ